MSTPPSRKESVASDTLASGLISKPVRTSPTSIRAQRPRSRSPLQHLFKRFLKFSSLSLILTSAGALVGVSLWVGAIVVLRPHPPGWLAQYLPHWSKGWGEMPIQTLADIEAELTAQQQSAGKFLDLSTFGDDTRLEGIKLLPIFEQRSPCNRNCEEIAEIRLYGIHHREGQTDYLQQLHQLTVQGPAEETVLDPLSHGDLGTVGSTHQLPLDAIKPLQDDELPGVWLTLTGRWRTQGSPVLYGQLLYVDPQTLQVNPLLGWKSPPGRLPTWHNVDGEGLPELFVNQTYGLEPDYSLYEVSNLTAANTSTRLQEIALNPIKLPQDAPTKPYQDALFLAQQGLWSDAEQHITDVKRQLETQWTADLEQQFQLISLHAQFSQSQANRDWSQPNQKLLVLLLDGQWDIALKSLNSSESNFERAVLPLLKRDSARIWQRLTASLKIRPGQKSARLWGALLLMAKENEEAALKWLTQGKDSPLKEEFEAIAQKVNPPEPEVTVASGSAKPKTQSVSQTETASSPSLRLDGFFGTVAPISTVNPDEWRLLTEDGDLTLPSGQQWYAVTLRAGHSEQQWRSPSALSLSSTPPAIASLATFGLGTDSTLDVIHADSGQFIQTIQVRGVRQQGNVLTLLTYAAPLLAPPDVIATTPGQWVSVAQMPSQPLSQFLQAQPEMSDRLRPLLQNHLGYDLTNPAANNLLSSISVRQVRFTNSSLPDILLTIPPQSLSSDPNPVPINLIVTPAGKLLYSTRWSGVPAVLSGWIQSISGIPGLVIVEGDQPRLLTWSSQNGQFAAFP